MGNGKYVTVSEGAQQIQRSPRDLSDAIYQRRIEMDRLIKAGDRWLIPVDMLPHIDRVLRDRDQSRRQKPQTSTTARAER
jgi:hypothetical protein